MKRFWYAQNHAYCMASAYLSSQRGDAIAVADWEARAGEWQRKLDQLDIQRRYAC